MNTGIVGLTETTRHNEKELGKSVSSSSNGFGGHYIWKNHLFININSIVITIIIIKMRLITIFIIKMGSLGGWFEVQGGKKLDKKRKSCLPEQRGQRLLLSLFNTIESIRRRKNRKYQKVQKGTRKKNWKRGNVAFCGNEASGNFFIVSTSLKQPETRTRKYQGKNEKVQKGTRKNWRRWNVAFLWQWCQKDATDQKMFRPASNGRIFAHQMFNP